MKGSRERKREREREREREKERMGGWLVGWLGPAKMNLRNGGTGTEG